MSVTTGDATSVGSDVAVAVESASFGYHRGPVVTNLSLEIRRGDYLGMVGPNGCGKTTFLRGILGIIKPLSGRVVYPGGRPRFGYVPQRDAIDPIFPFTAEDVVAMAVRSSGSPFRPMKVRSDRARASEALRAVNVFDLKDRPYRDLSGGQKQRVLIARALSVEPDLLVLDEPTSGMDLGTERQILVLLERMAAERHIAIIIVSHDLHLVANETRTVLVFSGRGKTLNGPVEDVITGPALSRLYGVPFDVVEIHGRRAIVPGDRPL